VPQGHTARYFSLTPGSPATDLAWPQDEVLPACTRTKPGAPPDHYLVGVAAPSIDVDGAEVPLTDEFEGAFGSANLGLLELGPPTACWRGALVREPVSIALRGTGSSMTGTLLASSRSITLSCRIE